MAQLNSVQSSVPSQQRITQAGKSFFIGSHEFESLLGLHRDLRMTLGRVRTHLLDGNRAYGNAEINEHIGRSLFQGVPFGYGRNGPSFVTTEVVLNEDRQPYLVSLDTHSARHWDAMIGLSRSIPSTVTSTTRLVEAIQERARGRRNIIMIDGSSEHFRHASISRALASAGLSVEYRSLSRMKTGIPDGSVVFDLPYSERGYANLRAEASFIVEPLPYLSGQYLLSFLGNAQQSADIEDILQNSLHVSDRLRGAIPGTVLSGSTYKPKTFVVKSASPFSSQRVISQRSNQSIESEGLVLQERIEPLKIRLSETHTKCPLRFIFISYDGEIVTGMAIARIPANGHPMQDVAMDIVIR